MIFNMVGGGGGSSTKSTIIVSIETGSTVGIYDSTYTTLIKSASEKSTGEYWLTGLDNGTYYLKATKGSDVSTLTYTISQYGVYRVVMGYQVINYLMLYDGSIGDATLNQCSSVTGGYVATNLFGVKHYFHHIKNATATYNMVSITPNPVYGNNPSGDNVFTRLSAETDVNTLQTA